MKFSNLTELQKLAIASLILDKKDKDNFAQLAVSEFGLVEFFTCKLEGKDIFPKKGEKKNTKFLAFKKDADFIKFVGSKEKDIENLWQ